MKSYIISPKDREVLREVAKNSMLSPSRKKT